MQETCSHRGDRRSLNITNQIERLNGEIKRRTEVVGIFAIVSLIGAILLEQMMNGRSER